MKILICVLCANLAGAAQLNNTCDIKLIASTHNSVLLSLISILSAMRYFEQYLNLLCRV